MATAILNALPHWARPQDEAVLGREHTKQEELDALRASIADKEVAIDPMRTDLSTATVAVTAGPKRSTNTPQPLTQPHNACLSLRQEGRIIRTIAKKPEITTNTVMKLMKEAA